MIEDILRAKSIKIEMFNRKEGRKEGRKKVRCNKKARINM